MFSSSPTPITHARIAHIDVAPLERAVVRLQARRTTRRMIAEMVDRPDPRHGRAPLWVDLEALA
jgi:hypothetical protein